MFSKLRSGSRNPSPPKPQRTSRALLALILVLALLVPTHKAFALFGIDDIAQFIQLIRIARQTYDQAQMTARFIRTPWYWKQVAERAGDSAIGVLAQKSNGMDAQTLQTLNQTIQSSIAVLKNGTASSDAMTTSDALESVLLQVEAVRMKREHDQLQTTLQYQQDVQAYQQQVPATHVDLGWIPSR